MLIYKVGCPVPSVAHRTLPRPLPPQCAFVHTPLPSNRHMRRLVFLAGPLHLCLDRVGLVQPQGGRWCRLRGRLHEDHCRQRQHRCVLCTPPCTWGLADLESQISEPTRLPRRPMRALKMPPRPSSTSSTLSV